MSDRRYTDDELRAAFIKTFDDGLFNVSREVNVLRGDLEQLDFARPKFRELEKRLIERAAFLRKRGEEKPGLWGEFDFAARTVEEDLKDLREVAAIKEESPK